MKKLFAGNWKMNLGPAQARALVEALRAYFEPDAAALGRDREVMVAPPAILIAEVAQALPGSAIALGAQNMHDVDAGAFTGEISAPMLKAFGVSYVIVGHSERRHIFHEPDDLINRKLRSALRHGIAPILCVGETQDQRDQGKTLEVVYGQLERGMAEVAAGDIARVVVAYEPVWAIGTGRTATPEQAEVVHGSIRAALEDRYGREQGRTVRLLYGGSVTPENVDSLVAKPAIDGALVGGASLKADSFARIIRARF